MLPFRRQLSGKPLPASTPASHGAETKAQGYGAILFRGGFGVGARQMGLLLSPPRKGINPNYSNQKRFI
jgi:hypothetical protein